MTHIFVGGAQRSGTTLLSRLLCAGPDTNAYQAECSGLRAILESFELMRKRFADETVHHMGSRAVLDGFYRDTLRNFFDIILSVHAPAKRLVLKEPHMTAYFTHLYHLVPNCQFVLIMRDPRDVVASMLAVGRKMAEIGRSHLYNGGDLARIARLVQSYYNGVFEGESVNPAFAKACTWVRYETLVSDPASILAELKTATGLNLEGVDPANPARVDGTGDTKLSARQKLWVTPAQESGTVTDERVRSYRETLNSDQIAAIEAAIYPLFLRFGYDFETEEAAKLAAALPGAQA